MSLPHSFEQRIWQASDVCILLGNPRRRPGTRRLGVNERRVSQLHKRAVSILRVRMVGSGVDRERT